MTRPDLYYSEIKSWRAQRLSRLTAENGWLNVVGRFWFEEQEYSVGAAADNDVVLDSGPDHVGRFERGENGVITFLPFAGGDSAVLDPAIPEMKWHQADPILIEAINFKDDLVLRLRDRNAPARLQFAGIDHFDINPEWRISADWVTLESPLTMEVDTVVGHSTLVEVKRVAKFNHDGVQCELLPTHGSAESPMFVLRDATAGKQTYGASRFLVGTNLTDDTIILDFNKAINPPCTFTSYALCPLPPRQNIMPFPIEAGERKPR